MSMRYKGAINKPGFNPLGAQTTTTTYLPYLYSWGMGSGGALGLGNTTNYSSPKQVGSLTNWLKIDNSNGTIRNAYSIKNDGTLWAWGKNQFGQLGLNNTTDYSSPKQVGSLTTWVSVSSGVAFALAIQSDGTLYAWGYNVYGQLGLGDTTYRSRPFQVGSLTNWSVVSVGNQMSYAIKTNGTLWAWGRNNRGQLGLINTTSYSSPMQIGSLTNWLSVAGGYDGYAIAVKTDGTLWSWGANNTGQLGLGTTSYGSSSPQQVGALTNWTSNITGSYWTLAIKTDGTLWSWGYNGTGGLALGNTTWYSSPKQVGSLTTWSSVSNSQSHSLAIKTDGTFWSWGNNGSGQGGLGNTTDYSSPKQVGSSTTWLAAAAGPYISTGLSY
jgi:hypothetical protein